MRKLILFQILILCTNLSFSQMDETTDYIEDIPSKWVVGGQFGSFSDSRVLIDEKKLEFEFASSVQPTVGFFLKYKKLPQVKLSFPIGQDNSPGSISTKGFNIGIHMNPIKKFVVDAYYARLSRYNLRSVREFLAISDTLSAIPLPSMKTNNIALNINYILNDNKYSYKHGFGVGHRQLKSAGSFMLGLSINITNQEKSEALADYLDVEVKRIDFSKISAFQVAFLGGYAHNWVFGKKKRGFVSSGLFAGPNIHSVSGRFFAAQDSDNTSVFYSVKFLLSGGFRTAKNLQFQFKFFFNDYGYRLSSNTALRNRLLDGELAIVKYFN